jgi:hypothetical protein
MTVAGLAGLLLVDPVAEGLVAGAKVTGHLSSSFVRRQEQTNGFTPELLRVLGSATNRAPTLRTQAHYRVHAVAGQLQVLPVIAGRLRTAVRR